MSSSQNNSLKAIVIGHTGATGKALLDVLIADSKVSSIVAIGRRESERHRGVEKLTQIVLPDLSRIEELDSTQVGAPNAAFVCIGTPFNDVFRSSKADEYRRVDFGIVTAFATFARQHGVDFFSVVTGEGSDAKSAMRMARVKGETEDFIRQLGFARVAFLRPGFLNRGADAGWVERALSLGGLFGLPVAAVAHAMVDAALAQAAGEASYDNAAIRRAAAKRTDGQRAVTGAERAP